MAFTTYIDLNLPAQTLESNWLRMPFCVRRERSFFKAYSTIFATKARIDGGLSQMVDKKLCFSSQKGSLVPYIFRSTRYDSFYTKVSRLFNLSLSIDK